MISIAAGVQWIQIRVQNVWTRIRSEPPPPPATPLTTVQPLSPTQRARVVCNLDGWFHSVVGHSKDEMPPAGWPRLLVCIIKYKVECIFASIMMSHMGFRMHVNPMNCLNLFMRVAKIIQAAKYMIITLSCLNDRIQYSLVYFWNRAVHKHLQFRIVCFSKAHLLSLF